MALCGNAHLLPGARCRQVTKRFGREFGGDAITPDRSLRRNAACRPEGSVLLILTVATELRFFYKGVDTRDAGV